MNTLRRPAYAGPVQRVRPVRLTRRQLAYLRLRRRIDVVLALGGLVLAAIPMALVAIGVRLTMGRPVLFAQERMTQSGRIFTLWKFRSMRHAGAPGSDEDEDRLVPFGRFIRNTSLDELPSLWNIVRGDMALVGPRPLPTYYLGRFGGEQFARHTVPAGLTGHAQVHGRNEVEWDARMQLDQEYVQRLGPLLDLQILRDTVGVVLGRRGVQYEGGLTASTDFPGPQSTADLELEGLGPDGSWQCRDRQGRVLVQGTVQVLGGGLVLIAMIALGVEAVTGGVLLEESILLLISRLRARERATWVGLAPEVEPAAPLREALERNGFVAPDAGSRFPTDEHPPALMDGRAPALLAFVERPQAGFPPPAPLVSMWPGGDPSAPPLDHLEWNTRELDKTDIGLIGSEAPPLSSCGEGDLT